MKLERKPYLFVARCYSIKESDCLNLVERKIDPAYCSNLL